MLSEYTTGMNTNDRVASEYNTGTVKRMGEKVSVIAWDGFAWAIEIPTSLLVTFKVVGHVEPVVEETPAYVEPLPDFLRDQREQEYEGACDTEAAKRLGD